MRYYLEAEGDNLTHVVGELFPGWCLNLASRRRRFGCGLNGLLIERAQATCQRQLWAVQESGGRGILRGKY